MNHHAPKPYDRLIFLDFDGVLHHLFPVKGAPDEQNAHFYFLPNLERVIRQSLLNIGIVVSSTWRINRSLHQLQKPFSPDIAPKVFSVTPRVSKATDQGGRLREIEAWLDQNNSHHIPWVAIDDHLPVFLTDPPQPIALILCPDQFGPEQEKLLTEALIDPRAFAKNHPLPPPSSKRTQRIDPS